MAILITKADGTSEPFNVSKLRHSLVRAGASEPVAEEIGKEVAKELYNGITTNQIYHKAFAHLREHRRGVAARYSLKRAILEFGPSGFPFEIYLAELFKTEGYDAVTDQIIQGGCVEHEVDVVLTRERKKIFIEAKFHNNAGFKTDLKTVLYVKARMDDIQKAMPHTPVQGMVITNTKFTHVAVRYADCVGLELLGWEHPAHGDLHSKIDSAKLYPITALTTLSRNEKTALLAQKKVLCSQLSQDTRALSAAGVRGKRADAVLEEVGALCMPVKDI
jgi:HJR/Mrr/RecB family endonuclease